MPTGFWKTFATYIAVISGFVAMGVTMFATAFIIALATGIDVWLAGLWLLVIYLVAACGYAAYSLTEKGD